MLVKYINTKRRNNLLTFALSTRVLFVFIYICIWQWSQTPMPPIAPAPGAPGPPIPMPGMPMPIIGFICWAIIMSSNYFFCMCWATVGSSYILCSNKAALNWSSVHWWFLNTQS